MTEMPDAAHPPIPRGTATYAGIGGAIAGVAMGIVGWAVDHRLDPADTVLIASGFGTLIAVIAGRSAQAKEAIRAFANAFLADTAPPVVDQEETVDPDPVQDMSVAVVPAIQPLTGPPL
jgi:hypothetical protein